MKWLADLHLRYRRSIAAAAIGLTVIAFVGASRLQFDDDPRSVTRSSDVRYTQLQEYYKVFSADDQDVVLVIEGQDLFSSASIAALRELQAKLEGLQGVSYVVSILNLHKSGPIPLLLIPRDNADPDRLLRAKENALQNPSAVGHFLSADGKVTLMVVRLAGSNLPVTQLQPLMDSIRSVAKDSLATNDLRFLFAGHPPIRVDLNLTLRDETGKFALLSAAVSGIIAFLIFRSWPAIVISVAGPLTGIVWTLGLMGLFGIAIDPLSVILPTLLFVVGFTDSVHIVSEICRTKSPRADYERRVGQAVMHVSTPCVLTALTTMAGFGSLAVAKAEYIGRFGLTCAAGAAVMLVAVQIVVPALALSRLGGALRCAEMRTDRTTALVAPLLPFYTWMLRRPRAVALTSVVVTLACFLLSLQLRADQIWVESLPEDSDIVRVTQKTNEAFGGCMLGYVVIEWPEGLQIDSKETIDAMLAVHAACGQVPPLRAPFSLVNLLQSIQPEKETIYDQTRRLKKANVEITKQLYSTEARQAVVSVRTPDVGAAALEPAFTKLEGLLENLERAHPGFRFHLTGTVVVAARSIYEIIGDLGRSLTLASTLIFVLMTIVYRSWQFGVLSVVPNIFPQALTAAALVTMGQTLTLTTVMTFSLCLGLSVDDTVHFLLRYKQHRARRGVRASLLATYREVGGVMIATTLVLIGGFSIMIISQMPAVRMFAWLSCITLAAAVLGDLIMLPSLLAWKVGPRAFSRPSRGRDAGR